MDLIQKALDAAIEKATRAANLAMEAGRSPAEVAGLVLAESEPFLRLCFTREMEKGLRDHGHTIASNSLRDAADMVEKELGI